MCCENSLIMINMNCIICTVTDGYNVWVSVGLSRYVYAGRYIFICVCVCVWGGGGCCVLVSIVIIILL